MEKLSTTFRVCFWAEARWTNSNSVDQRFPSSGNHHTVSVGKNVGQSKLWLGDYKKSAIIRERKNSLRCINWQWLIGQAASALLCKTGCKGSLCFFCYLSFEDAANAIECKNTTDRKLLSLVSFWFCLSWFFFVLRLSDLYLEITQYLLCGLQAILFVIYEKSRQA